MDRLSESLRNSMIARAASLYLDGYRIEPLSGLQFRVFDLRRPASSYRLDLRNHTCACKSFQRHRICKHLLGWRYLLEDTCDEYGRRQQALATRRACTPEQRAWVRRLGQRLSDASWELHATFNHLRGNGEFYLPSHFVGYQPLRKGEPGC